MTRFLIALALILLPACATAPKPIIVPERIDVPRYIRAPLSPEFVQDRIVAEPDPACWIDTQRAFCNKQIAMMLNDYRAALRQSNIDKAALRACCNPKDKPP